RRHTSFSRDWSSDVCSSDLEVVYRSFLDMAREQGVKSYEAGGLHRLGKVYLLSGKLDQAEEILLYSLKFCEENGFRDELSKSYRSEERRVGEEWDLCVAGLD